MAQLSYPYMTTGKTIALTRQTFVGQVMSLLFKMLSKLVIAFLPKSKRLNFMAAVINCNDFGAQENKVCHCFLCFPVYLPWVMGPDVMIFVFWMLSLKLALSLSFFTFSKWLFSSFSILAIRVVSSANLRLLTFLLAMIHISVWQKPLQYCEVISLQLK